MQAHEMEDDETQEHAMQDDEPQGLTLPDAVLSEVFAAGLQQLGRVTVVGRPTAGAALPAHFTELPNEDGFMFAVADFIGPAGRSIEGSGVIPDIEVPIDRARLLSEGDPDIAAAGRWIISELERDTSP